MNESAALEHLLDHGHLTRADLRDLTGLSKPTISEALRRLTEAGLASVVGHISGGPGPNAEVYAANADAAYAIAVSVRDNGDIDIPSLTGAACDLSGEIRGRAEMAVDFLGTDPVIAVTEIVERLRDEADMPASRLVHVQLAVAASYDPQTESIRHVGVPGGWSRPGLVGEIRDRLGTRVGVDNDVNLAAVAERRRGVGRDADGFALLWLGDEGLGLAIDLGGRLLRGARGGAGEIGYMPLFTSAGKDRVDLQDLVGGPAVLTLAAEHGISGRTPAEAVAAAVAGDQDTSAPFFAALADRVLVGLAAVVAVLDPPLVVLAGQVAQAGGQALREAVTAAMVRAAPLETTIAVTTIDDDAALLGALDAGLAAVREALIASVHESTN
jgi:predicted NBD/HSP70 family sugar kinase